jgi:hypothetical protein
MVLLGPCFFRPAPRGSAGEAWAMERWQRSGATARRPAGGRDCGRCGGVGRDGRAGDGPCPAATRRNRPARGSRGPGIARARSCPILARASRYCRRWRAGPSSRVRGGLSMSPTTGVRVVQVARSSVRKARTAAGSRQSRRGIIARLPWFLRAAACEAAAHGRDLAGEDFAPRWSPRRVRRAGPWPRRGASLSARRLGRGS